MHLSNSDDRVIESNKTILTSSDMIDIDHKARIVNVPCTCRPGCNLLPQNCIAIIATHKIA